MTTSEPTTGEIVRMLRDEAQFELGGKRSTILLTTIQSVIDRLESQERELSGITGELERMTARAEQSERERDAVIADLDALKDSGFCNSCVGCNAPHSESITYCTDWKRRGLPQEGEGV